MYDEHDPFAALNRVRTVRAQALKLMMYIIQADTAEDLFRAADRAEGFVLGLETAQVLGPATIEGLYRAFERRAMARLMVPEP